MANIITTMYNMFLERQTMENLNSNILIWSVFFLVCLISAPKILQIFFPSFWNGLSEKRKKEVGPYIVSFINHIPVVTLGCKLLINYYVYHIDPVHEDFEILCPFVMGYFVGDTIFYALPEAIRGNPIYVVHHLLGLWLSFACKNGSTVEIFLFYISMLITEVSSIMFNFSWLLGCTSYKSSVYASYVDVLFALSFFITRIVNLPFSLYKAWSATMELGIARYTMIPILAMQFYWFYKIVAAVTKRGKDVEKQR